MSSDSIVALAVIGIFGVMLGLKLFLYPTNPVRTLVTIFLFIIGMYITIRLYPRNQLGNFFQIAFALAYAVYALLFDHD